MGRVGLILDGDLSRGLETGSPAGMGWLRSGSLGVECDIFFLEDNYERMKVEVIIKCNWRPWVVIKIMTNNKRDQNERREVQMRVFSPLVSVEILTWLCGVRGHNVLSASRLGGRRRELEEENDNS